MDPGNIFKHLLLSSALVLVLLLWPTAPGQAPTLYSDNQALCSPQSSTANKSNDGLSCFAIGLERI